MLQSYAYLCGFRSAGDALWPFALKPFPPLAPQPQSILIYFVPLQEGSASYRCGQIWPAACLCKLLYWNAAMSLHRWAVFGHFLLTVAALSRDRMALKA